MYRIAGSIFNNLKQQPKLGWFVGVDLWSESACAHLNVSDSTLHLSGLVWYFNFFKNKNKSEVAFFPKKKNILISNTYYHCKIILYIH